MKHEKDWSETWNLIEIPQIFQNTRFYTYEDKINAVQTVCSFVEGVFPGNEWCLYLHGHSGVGKSMLAVKGLMHYFYLAHNSKKYVSGLFLSSRTYFRKIRQCFNDPVAMENLMDKMENIDLLVFDDLGICQGLEWELSKLCDFIEARCEKQKRTIFTSNWNMETLYEKLGHRVCERISYGIIALVTKSQYHGLTQEKQPKQLENAQNCLPVKK